MKLYIIGSVASGKSTLATKISKRTGVPCHHLDEVVHVPDITDSWGNRKRSVEERDAIFANIISQPHFIIEDAGRAYFEDGLKRADTIILLETPINIRRKRIVIRYIKQKLGIEKCIYKPQLDMVKSMFKWIKNYESGADGVKDRLVPYQNKMVVLRDNKETDKFLLTLQ